MTTPVPPVVSILDGYQTDVFVVDKTGQLNVFWVDGAGQWQGPGKLGPADFATPGSAVTASQQFMDVPAPAAGLGSNSNYFLNENGANLDGVAVTIATSSDIVASAGFGFQLNAYSPTNETCAIQQYVINVDTSGQMDCIVNNWQNAETALINNWLALHKLPDATLPAGYQCQIALQNDSSGNITAATFIVSTQSGVLASVTQTLLDIAGVSSTDLSPIVAFELDIVGYDDGQSTSLSSGSGTITYTAAGAMEVANSEPSFCEFDGGTLETANTSYGQLPASMSAAFVQTFNTSSQVIQAPKRKGLIKRRPSPRTPDMAQK